MNASQRFEFQAAMHRHVTRCRSGYGDSHRLCFDVILLIARRMGWDGEGDRSDFVLWLFGVDTGGLAGTDELHRRYAEFQSHDATQEQPAHTCQGDTCRH